jgi:hypothetical protein
VRLLIRGWAGSVIGDIAVREEGRGCLLLGKRMGEMKGLVFVVSS